MASASGRLTEWHSALTQQERCGKLSRLDHSGERRKYTDRDLLKVFISTREVTCEECGEELGSRAWITLVGESSRAFCPRTWLDVAAYREDARRLAYDEQGLDRLVDRWKSLLEKARGRT